jgi:hypothetical protein
MKAVASAHAPCCCVLGVGYKANLNSAASSSCGKVKPIYEINRGLVRTCVPRWTGIVYLLSWSYHQITSLRRICHEHIFNFLYTLEK